MKKTKTIEYVICDFHEDGEEVAAIAKAEPTGKDVCKEHARAFKQEVRHPAESGGEMSGIFAIVDPDYDSPEIQTVYKKVKNK